MRKFGVWRIFGSNMSPLRSVSFSGECGRKGVATEDNLKKIRVSLASNCYCCDGGNEETIKAMEAICFLCRDLHGGHPSTAIDH